MALSERVRDVVTGALDADLILYDLDFQGGVLRVTLDLPGGIDIDRLAEANRAISRALDVADPIPGRFTLEVTSPGLERTLRTAEHWRGALDERVRVKLNATTEGDRRLEGVVASVDDDSATLVTADGTEQRVAFDEVERARTVFEWGPAPKPGGPKRSTTPSAASRTKETET